MLSGDLNDRRMAADRDDEPEDSGYGGGMSYDEEDDEDGGWAINKDHSDSLWDSAEDSDDEDEEEDVLVFDIVKEEFGNA